MLCVVRLWLLRVGWLCLIVVLLDYVGLCLIVFDCFVVRLWLLRWLIVFDCCVVRFCLYSIVTSLCFAFDCVWVCSILLCIRLLCLLCVFAPNPRRHRLMRRHRALCAFAGSRARSSLWRATRSGTLRRAAAATSARRTGSSCAASLPSRARWCVCLLAHLCMSQRIDCLTRILRIYASAVVWCVPGALHSAVWRRRTLRALLWPLSLGRRRLAPALVRRVDLCLASLKSCCVLRLCCESIVTCALWQECALSRRFVGACRASVALVGGHGRRRRSVQCNATCGANR